MNCIELLFFDLTAQNSVISTQPNDLSNWPRLSSLWQLFLTGLLLQHWEDTNSQNKSYPFFLPKTRGRILSIGKYKRSKEIRTYVRTQLQNEQSLQALINW
ncbi:hypothetical protein CIPAW_04G122400 [Carya illinoinensis]|uniref:Uncharacterized protein n=1 Tax=Carya illinoinensis TaxID=32201 RepID=A0A8T1QU19_CARIL|nr:hypothetical protein CIPAW_04G122400 [Carya illinoinensis]